MMKTDSQALHNYGTRTVLMYVRFKKDLLTFQQSFNYSIDINIDGIRHDSRERMSVNQWATKINEKVK